MIENGVFDRSDRGGNWGVRLLWRAEDCETDFRLDTTSDIADMVREVCMRSYLQWGVGLAEGGRTERKGKGVGDRYFGRVRMFGGLGDCTGLWMRFCRVF